MNSVRNYYTSMDNPKYVMHFIFIFTVGYRLSVWGAVCVCLLACMRGRMYMITCKQVELLPSNNSSVIANNPLRINPVCL